MSKKNEEPTGEVKPEALQEMQGQGDVAVALPSPVTLMYCGPSIPGVAAHGMLFTVMPAPMEQCVKECSAINSFVVEPKEYVKVKQETERRGSLLYIQHRTVLEYLQRR